MKVKRIPKVVVHESSSSDTDEESVPAVPEVRAKDTSLSNPLTDMSSNREWDDSQFMSASNDDAFNSNYFIEPTGLFLSSNINPSQDFTDVDMDISNEESNPVVTKKGETSVTTITTTTTTANQNQTQIITLKHQDDLSRYYILRHGRLYCNFNPSLSNTRGCQNNFSERQMDKLISHLNVFHGCSIDQTIGPVDEDGKSESSSHDKFYSPFGLSPENDYHTLDLISTATTTTISGNEKFSQENNMGLISISTQQQDHHQSFQNKGDMTPQCGAYLNDVLDDFLYSGSLRSNITQSDKQVPHEYMNCWSMNSTEKSDTTLNSLTDNQPPTISLADIEYRQQEQEQQKQQEQQEPESSINEPPENKLNPPENKSNPSENKPNSPDRENIASSTTQPDTISNSIIPKIEDPTLALKKRCKRPIVSKVTPKLLRSVTRKSDNHTTLANDTSASSKKEPVSKVTHMSRRIAPTLSKEPPTPKPHEKKVEKTLASIRKPVKRPRGPILKTNTTKENPSKKKRVFVLNTDSPSSSSSYLPTDNNTSTETTPELSSLMVEKREQTPIPDRIMAGEEAWHVVPALPTDGLWPFEYGYGFHMKKMYHCNVTRSIGAHGCKATFLNRSVFIQHLNHVHRLHAGNGKNIQFFFWF